MDFTQLANFIRKDLLIICAVLYALGYFLKLYPKFKNDWTIPFILLGTSVVICPVYLIIVIGLGPLAEIIISGIIQGILIAALAVFANQLIKQISSKRLKNQQKTTGDTLLEDSQVYDYKVLLTPDAKGAAIHKADDAGEDGDPQ